MWTSGRHGDDTKCRLSITLWENTDSRPLVCSLTPNQVLFQFTAPWDQFKLVNGITWLNWSSAFKVHGVNGEEKVEQPQVQPERFVCENTSHTRGSGTIGTVVGTCMKSASNTWIKTRSGGTVSDQRCGKVHEERSSITGVLYTSTPEGFLQAPAYLKKTTKSYNRMILKMHVFFA